ncbi:MAG: ParA family protein [Burkholderiales bacterium]|nr:ParA family protein [Burkholderiales bacterium]
MIVSLYSTKGGCGKSTLAVCLAAYWSQTKKTALLDADPQASLSVCRPEVLHVPVFEDTSRDVGKTIARLAGEYERVVIDTAGYQRRKSIEALEHSDFVLIPCKPSPFDLREAMQAVELLREIAGGGKRKDSHPRYAVVLTMAQRTAVSAQIREDLQHSGVPFMSAQIGQRVAFVETPSIGFPPPGSVAALEIELLAKELRRRLRA